MKEEVCEIPTSVVKKFWLILLEGYFTAMFGEEKAFCPAGMLVHSATGTTMATGGLV